MSLYSVYMVLGIEPRAFASYVSTLPTGLYPQHPVSFLEGVLFTGNPFLAQRTSCLEL